MKEEQPTQNSIPADVQFPVDYHENISMLIDMFFKLDEKVSSGEMDISISMEVIAELRSQLDYVQCLYKKRGAYINRQLPLKDD